MLFALTCSAIRFSATVLVSCAPNSLITRCQSLPRSPQRNEMHNCFVFEVISSISSSQKVEIFSLKTFFLVEFCQTFNCFSLAVPDPEVIGASVDLKALSVTRNKQCCSG